MRKLVLTGKCIAAQALEHMPALAEVFRGGAVVDDDAVLERLAARGITVD